MTNKKKSRKREMLDKWVTPGTGRRAQKNSDSSDSASKTHAKRQRQAAQKKLKSPNKQKERRHCEIESNEL